MLFLSRYKKRIFIKTLSFHITNIIADYRRTIRSYKLRDQSSHRFIFPSTNCGRNMVIIRWNVMPDRNFNVQKQESMWMLVSASTKCLLKAIWLDYRITVIVHRFQSQRKGSTLKYPEVFSLVIEISHNFFRR